MITVNGHVLLDMPQDWSESCRYGLVGKSGRSDNLKGAEDRVMFSATPRRSYGYSVLARGIAQRMDYSATLTAAMAGKKAAVPIWCKSRFDFTSAGLDFTFDDTVPEIGSYWVLHSGFGDLTVLLAASYPTEDTVTFTVVEGSNGLHAGELCPLLFGYIKPPGSKLVGGDCEGYRIEFIQATFTEE